MKKTGRILVCLCMAVAMLLMIVPLTGMAAEPGPAEAGEKTAGPAEPEGAPGPAAASEPVETGSAPGPEGAAEAPESVPGEAAIGTAAELLAFADVINSGTCEQAYGVPAERLQVTLAADIDMAGVPFAPIGTLEHPFSGTFDGGGFTISGLVVSADTGAGLFGFAKDAKITNLNIAAAAVSARTMAGGVAGYAENSEISNCTVSGGIRAEENLAGGIAGALVGGSITGCTARDITVTAVENAGGIAGMASCGVTAGGQPVACMVADCESGAAITADWFSGGVVGTLGAASAENCAFTGSLTIGGGDSGLIAGWVTGGGAVSGCASSSRITGDGGCESGAQVGWVAE